jgi:hypothetical protein
MEMALVVQHLRRKRIGLLRAYVLHVGWFASTCAFAATDTSQAGMTASFWLTLITVPVVLICTVTVHKACRAVDPTAHSVGWLAVIVATVCFTPFESGLILPARNLWVSRRILRAWDKSAAPQTDPHTFGVAPGFCNEFVARADADATSA